MPDAVMQLIVAGAALGLVATLAIDHLRIRRLTRAMRRIEEAIARDDHRGARAPDGDPDPDSPAD